MTQLSLQNYQGSEVFPGEVVYVSWWEWCRRNFLLLIVLGIDLFTPFFVWRLGIPSAVRFVSDLALLGMMAIVLLRMLKFDRIPAVFWFILAITTIGTITAVFEGQNTPATIWGWWVLFRYPMAWLYLYVQPYWPENFSRSFMKLCLMVLTFEVVFQLGMFAIGYVPNDDLAGTFGRHGVGPLVYFIFVVLCFALGRWLTTGDWKTLLYVLVLGVISSTLGEMKIFPFAAVGLLGVAFMLHMVMGGQIRRLILYLGMFALLTFGFATVYNNVFVPARNAPRIEEYLDPDFLESYLNATNYDTTTGTYYLGRGFALQYGWSVIQRDAPTFLFGMGLGSRGESRSLGIVGEGLEQSAYGINSGTSLLVLMQELGMLGLGAILAFGLWIFFTMFKDVRRDPFSSLSVLRFGIMIFTSFWLFWLYYHRALDFSVALLTYGIALAYCMRMRGIVNADETIDKPRIATFGTLGEFHGD